MKLEEKRRQIEQEKRKVELAMSRQQQKVGQAAFLQAINKVIIAVVRLVDGGSDGIFGATNPGTFSYLHPHIFSLESQNMP